MTPRRAEPVAAQAGFADFQVGQVVSLTDDTGDPVAQGRLTSCDWNEGQEAFNVPGQPSDNRAKPLFQFSVTQVPEAQNLSFRVAWKLWVPPVTLSEMMASNWNMDLGVR